MARIYLEDYISIGTVEGITAVSWQFAKDAEFTKIIDESLEDTVHINSWASMLPKLEEDGEGYYGDLEWLYGRVKIHSGDYVSEWFECEPKTQQYQEVTITENDKEDIETDSDELKWWPKEEEVIPDPSLTVDQTEVNLTAGSSVTLTLDYVGEITYSKTTDLITITQNGNELKLETTATVASTEVVTITATSNSTAVNVMVTVNILVQGGIDEEN